MTVTMSESAQLSIDIFLYFLLINYKNLDLSFFEHSQKYYKIKLQTNLKFEAPMKIDINSNEAEESLRKSFQLNNCCADQKQMKF